MPVRLFTLGSVSLEVDGVSPIGRSSQRKRLALLVLLAGAGSRGIRREKLVDLLWADRSPEQARHALSQALYAVRQELGEEIVRAGLDDLHVDAGALTCDLWELEEALAAGRLEEAVSLHRGPFLDGFSLPDCPEFERWAEERRMQVHRKVAEALERLAEAAADAGRWEEAADRWGRRAALDPWDSRVATALMRSLVNAGNPGGALSHARVHAALLREEFELPPDPEVETLAEDIRGGRVVAVGPSTPPPAPPPEPDDPPAPVAAEEPSRSSFPADRRWWLLLPAGALALTAFAAGTWWGPGAAGAGRTEVTSVVLGTIRGADDGLTLAVREALAAELEAAPDVTVLGGGGVRETLRLMEIPEDAPITPDVAMEVAQRRGVRLVVTGSVDAVGEGLQLTAWVHDAASGEALAAFTQRPDRLREVLPAVARLASDLREAVTGVRVATTPALPAVSTRSLPALRNYALARQALARLDREEAIQHAEAALVHDSLFALAHYLLADALWYLDRNRHGEEHMRRAYELRDGLTPRERMAVQARYAHLVEDRPDSAVVHWRLLARAYPDEGLAYEGLRWAHRALGEWEEMAAAAEAGYLRDGTLLPLYVEDRIGVAVAGGDTTTAFALAREYEDRVSWPAGREARYQWAFVAGDWDRALDLLDPDDAYRRQVVHLAAGRVPDGRRELEALRRSPWMQALPRALLLQARAELWDGSPAGRTRAAALGREALGWTENADLSAPAYGRLAERIADVAARSGDAATLDEVRQFLLRLDGGRGLPSYRRALGTVEAARAWLRGDAAAAVRLAVRARDGIGYGRSVATLVLLEADARTASGDREGGAALYRLVADFPRGLAPGSFPDADPETRAVLAGEARRALAAMGR